MFRVIIVDDEPASLSHIETIILKKCTQYQVIATAENGQEAMQLIRSLQPDLILSDIKMPIMDGIELVTNVKMEFPEILSVIISGYQDFEYAKSALQSGVCDYLLKPLNPTDLQQLCDKMLEKLNDIYYEKRKKYLNSMCNHSQIAENETLKRYFPQGNYYSAIIRKNGLPRRFNTRTGSEIYFMENEKIFLYGRDEMEALYLIPKELIGSGSFCEMIGNVYAKEKGDYYYTTAILHEGSFELDQFPEISKKLYRQLDESIQIGKDQFRLDQNITCELFLTDAEKQCMEKIAYWVTCKDCSKIKIEIEQLFKLWEKKCVTQLYLEGQIRYIFQLIRNHQVLSNEQNERPGLEYSIDDAFYYATNLTELKESILSLLLQLLPQCGHERNDDRQELFQDIIAYLHQNMQENITLNMVCKKFGVSQTSLSKQFRLYQDCSFSNYLTKIRIEKAKQIMLGQPDTFIKEIAERVGYSDQFYFSRIFHSVEGVSPSDFLRNKCE